MTRFIRFVTSGLLAAFFSSAIAQNPDYIRHPASLPCGTNTYVQTLGSASGTAATCDGPIYYGTASGTNTYAVTASPVPGSYITGRTYVVTFTNANTSTATLNANTLGAKAIQKNGSALSAGDIPAGSTQDLVYDGTQFQLIGSSSSGGGSGTVTNIATTSPISGGPITTTGTISIADAAADGTTKGAATFTASDFNSSSGLISIDYTNGQAADATHKGFLTSTDWTTFNGKGSGTVTTTGSPASGNLTKFSGATSITNGDLSGDVTTSGTLTTTISNNAVTLAKLATQSDKTLLANISGGTAVPTASGLSAIIDNILGSTQGQILYRGSSAWLALSPGTAGQALVTNGPAADPSWSSVGSGSGGAMSYVGTATLGGAATSLLTGNILNLDGDQEYYVRGTVKTAAAGAGNVSFQFNTDTTPTNYDQQTFTSTTVFGAAQSNSSVIYSSLGNSIPVRFVLEIMKDMDGHPMFFLHSYFNSTSSLTNRTTGLVWRTTGSNVTQIGFFSSVTNGLASGSTFDVFKITH